MVQGDNVEFIAKTFFGLEPLLAKELEDLGAKNIKEGNRMVTFFGDRELLYKANLYCRTALKILMPIHSFIAETEEELYKGVQQIQWHTYFTNYDTFAVDSVVNSEIFTHSKYAALKTKDAIVDYFRSKTGRRPSVNIEEPSVQVHLHIYDKKCNILLDSSGDSLHRRGYRQDQTVAPINEVLAAGMILLTGWDGTTNFIDPMCGSGTILAEAGMIAANMPANYNRQRFGFMGWSDFDRRLWSKIRRQAKKAIVEPSINLEGSDLSEDAVDIALRNIVATGVEDFKIKLADFFDREPPKGEGVIITNPPYGERIGVEEINEFYASIGDRLKQKYKGYQAWIISSDAEAMKHIGLQASKKYDLFNGALECKYFSYDLY